MKSRPRGYPPEVERTQKSEDVLVRYQYGPKDSKSWFGFGYYDFLLNKWKINGNYQNYVMLEWFPLPTSGHGVEIPDE